MITQLSPQIRIKTPLGFGWCFFLMDYGLNINTIWIVRLDDSGYVKHFDSNDIQIDGNPMLGLPMLQN